VNPDPGVRLLGAPEGHDYISLCRGGKPGGPGEWQQQVDGDRPIGKRPGCGHLLLDPPRAIDHDRPQSPGGRNGGCQLVGAEPSAHASLDDRRLDAEPENHSAAILGT